MNSLKEVYAGIAQQDHVKVAQARDTHVESADYSDVDAGLMKQAQDYDNVGRILAHNVFSDMLKTALDESAPGAGDEEKAKALVALLAAANGEKAAEGEDEDESEEKSEEGEKKASAKEAILRRMSQDPQYVAHLVGKYYGR